jgi:hypothetical protein
LVIGIVSGFFVLLGISVYIAERSYDGPVEKDYYRKSLEYFSAADRGSARAASTSSAAYAGGRKVFLDISPEPVRVMKELTLTVEAPFCSGATPWIELGMAGMRMAPNRVELTRGSDGRFRGKGVLVRCPSGMRTWTAAVHLPGVGEALFTIDASD